MVEIVLNDEGYRCLMDQVSSEAPAYHALATGLHLKGHFNMPDQYVVTCSETDADALLAVAQRACRTAVPAITAGISKARSKA